MSYPYSSRSITKRYDLKSLIDIRYGDSKFLILQRIVHNSYDRLVSVDSVFDEVDIHPIKAKIYLY